jgi:hypothetical protein
LSCLKCQGLKSQQWDDIYKIMLENHEAAQLAVSVEDGGLDTNDLANDELLNPLYDDILMGNYCS